MSEGGESVAVLLLPDGDNLFFCVMITENSFAASAVSLEREFAQKWNEMFSGERRSEC